MCARGLGAGWVGETLRRQYSETAGPDYHYALPSGISLAELDGVYSTIYHQDDAVFLKRPLRLNRIRYFFIWRSAGGVRILRNPLF